MEYSDQKDLDGSRFAAVLQNLKQENIPTLASRVRHSGHLSTGIIDRPTTSQPISCELLPQITCGSFNAIFKIEFTDGTRWVLKVPATGHQRCWDAPASEALTSEALTMRLIKRETTVPVPEVFAFDASLENELGCPFILMEHINGKALHGVWWNQSVSHARREQSRVRSLHDIAEAMTQLSALTFSQGGSLLFDEKGDVPGMGSSTMFDLETQYANLRSPDDDDSMAFCQIGPFSDPKSHLLSLLDANEGKSERSIVEQGACKLLRLFIDWCIMRTETGREKPFVLSHPDLDSQNIFVDDDGTLTGIIDWDWTAAVPHSIGPQSLPKFLTEDFDPDNYDYDVVAGEPKASCLADSPEELASYRAMYAQFMESYLSDNDRMMAKNPRHARRIRLSRKDAANMTRRSLVTTTLQLAAKAPSEMQGLMKHLFKEIEKLTAAKWPNMPTTADSKEPDDGEEGAIEDGDIGASGVTTPDVADEKSCVSSPQFKGAALNVECLSIDELMGKIEQLTEASEMKIAGYVEEELCVGNPGSEERAVNLESLSIDDLMDQIENLTGRISAPSSTRDTLQGIADLQSALPAEEKIPEPRDETSALYTKSDEKGAHMPRAARVCVWVQKKLRRGAKHLHKQPERDDAEATPKHPGARLVRAVGTFCSWTEMKLRRVAYCLHCDNKDDTDKARVEFMIEAVRIGAIDVLNWLQTKLMQLVQKLHRKESISSVAFEHNGDEISQKQQVTASAKDCTRAELRSVCDKFLHMVQEKQLHLTADQQVVIAHWAIQMLEEPELSYMSSDHTDTRPKGQPERHQGDRVCENGDLEKDTGYGGGQKDGTRSGGDGKDGDEDNEETGQHDDGKEILEPVDRACIGQPSNLSQSEEGGQHATNTAGTGSSEKEPTEEPTASAEKAAVFVSKDTGIFNLFDICNALSKGDLDQRRMKRLREGFLSLLNQSV